MHMTVLNAMTSLNLHIDNTLEDQAIPSDQHFETWIKHTLQAFCNNAEISLSIIDEASMHELNRDSRGIDRPTNTLAFAYPQENELLPLFGEIVMCASVIASEAKELEIESLEHWAHLTVHSTLHLLGFDHKNDADALQMEAQEKTIMSTYGYQDPYLIGGNKHES